jgi:hypothetical protein
MKLIAFDKKSIEYAKLKEIEAFNVLRPHDCDCGRCEYEDDYKCPHCEEEFYIYDYNKESPEEYLGYDVKKCPECDKLSLYNWSDYMEIRNKIKEMDNPTPQ